ncbi:hypothetical protein [Mucilaginibacter jinjuensis]|uniref:Uncharacterized protein n=1 Tax=Mucilaginibacter jinjuensis TaxID=1176721 RepID=A0ABY7T422_9SPHI|nr:hypothetical protein [Mucilaginibacter jinjuensis]WCT10538.1 hypothetical protein PQO05_17515 [Mucilaginibacter jinjuensis]
MKTLQNIFTICILGIALAATAQTTHKDVVAVYHKSIDDDGKTLHIAIEGIKNKSQPIKFERTYDIKGMSKMQRDSIIKHVTDSLGVK